MSGIIQNYIVKRYLKNLLIVGLVLLIFILLIDYMEGSRRFSKNGLAFYEIFFLSLLKFPEILSQIFFFLIFVSGVVTFNQMQNSSELVVMQASGRGFMFLLRRLFLLVFTLGVLQIIALNPLATFSRDVYISYLGKYLQHSQSIKTNVAFPDLGIWLTQKHDGNTDYLVSIKNFGSGQNSFKNIYFICIECQEFTRGTFVSAKHAILTNGKWELLDVKIRNFQGQSNYLNKYEIVTKLTPEIIINRLKTESLIRNQVFNVWTLPKLIHMVEESGLSAQYLYAYLFQMMITPVYLVVLLLLAVSLNLVPPRHLKNIKTYSGAIVLIFIIFFFKNLLLGMTLAESLSIYLGVINPVIVILFFSIYKFLKQERAR